MSTCSNLSSLHFTISQNWSGANKCNVFHEFIIFTVYLIKNQFCSNADSNRTWHAIDFKIVLHPFFGFMRALEAISRNGRRLNISDSWFLTYSEVE